MLGETTDPSLGHPRAATVFDQRDLVQRLNAIDARRARQKAREPREPDLLWEEAGLHGSKKEAKLRPARSSRARVRTPVGNATGKLPRPPKKSLVTTPNVIVAAGLLGVTAYAVYLWRRQTRAERMLASQGAKR